MLRIGLTVVLVLSLLASLAGGEQGKTRVYRVGYLSLAPGPFSRSEAFRLGLRELGYTEGRDIIVEQRFAAGDAERFRKAAMELVTLNVDVIVAAGPEGTRSAREATSRIPIVMAGDTDPVGMGFVASLSRPGGNVPG
jgi:putative ABC transport system substrate-binding protein